MTVASHGGIITPSHGIESLGQVIPLHEERNEALVVQINGRNIQILNVTSTYNLQSEPAPKRPVFAASRYQITTVFYLL
jgi:hypothetical protein